MKKQVWVRRLVTGVAVALPLAASGIVLAAPGAGAAGTTIASVLGAAGPGNSVGGFAVLGLGGVDCSLATVNGNTGVAAGTFNNMAPCVENGNIYIGSGVSVSGHGSTITDQALLSQAVSDAESASSTFASLAATDTAVQSVSGGSDTFTATQSGINVVDLSSLTGSPSLTFSCGSFAGCQWVVNDSGAFQFTNGHVTLGGGMTSGNVVFNVTTNANVNFMVPGSGAGIFLAPLSSFTMEGTWNGEIIGNKVTLMSGTTITAPTPVAVVPITTAAGAIAAVVLIAAILAAAQWRSRRRACAA